MTILTALFDRRVLFSRSIRCRIKGRFLFALIAAILCAQVTLAQTGAGSIEGTISDATGAVIPGATVRVVNQATNVALQTTSNATGFYQAPGLFTGTYTVTASAAGMKTSRRAIDLLASQNATINFSLQLGEASQTVEVRGNEVQLVDTNDGAIGATLENQRINQLPMNGRDIVTLVNETTPGLEPCTNSPSCSNGEGGPALQYLVDGVTLNNRQFGGVSTGSQQMVDPDAIEQAAVQTDGSGAQFASPTTVVLSTKSGTNSLHGTLFYTARNNAFGIAKSRQDLSNFVAPKLIRNEFGVAFGGPVVIPHLYNGRNKTFWFLAYERFSEAQSLSEAFSTPTAAMRNGDFSGLVNSAGVLQQLYDPLTTASGSACAAPAADGGGISANKWCRQPFPTINGLPNQIPISRESPTAKILNDISPLPTNAENPLVGTNLTELEPEYDVEPQITFRIDQHFNENNQLFLRYTQNLTNNQVARQSGGVYQPVTLAADGFPYAANGEQIQKDALFAAGLGYTHIFSSTFFSQTDLSQQWFGQQLVAGGTPSANFEQKLGLPNAFGQPGLPEITGNFLAMVGSQYGYGVSSKTSTLDQTFTKTAGRHQLIFGGRLQLEQMGSNTPQKEDQVNFDGEDTGLYEPSTGLGSTAAAYPNTGQANADEFLGGASEYINNLEPPYQHFRDWETDLFLQDNFRISQKLTLNLGLRYEAHPAVWEGNGQMETFSLKDDAVVTTAPISQLIAKGLTTQAIITNDENNGMKFEDAEQAGLPPMLARNYNLNFNPRVGFAWLPFGQGRTVVRGGVGRFTYPTPIREGYENQGGNNPLTAQYLINYASAQYSPDGTKNYMLRSVPNSSSTYTYATTAAGGGTPIMGVNSTQAINTASTTAIAPGVNIISLSPDLPPTFITQGDFTIEQPLKWNSVLRVSYIYTHGTNLENTFYYNDHPSAMNWELATGTKPPSGSAVGPTNATTGEGPYDNISYGEGSSQFQKTGWSNYNALQANFQRIYRHGIAWQAIYVFSKSMRSGGDLGGPYGDRVLPYSAFVNSGSSATQTPIDGTAIAPLLPPPPPSGTPIWGYYKALNRWENYSIDPNNPTQHFQVNGIVDLPFGKGKKFLAGSSKALNEVVGGWQVAGDASIITQNFPVTTTNWGPTSKLQVYKHKTPIMDCRTGVCLKGYEWFNGYIPPSSVKGNSCAGTSAATVSGLPAGWVPYQTPIDTECGTTYYNKNETAINGVSGQAANTAIAYSPVPDENDNGNGLNTAIDITNPFGRTYLNGPTNYNIDLSLFKVFPITESVFLRVNIDAFNAFNVQGYVNPNSTDGTEIVQPGGVGASSYNTPRQIQLTARLTF